MAQIVIDGLDIAVSQTITGIRLNNARQIERTDEGMQSNVSVTLMSGEAPLGNRKIRKAIQGNTFMTWVELNVASQASLTKDFSELTMSEAQQVQGEVLATKMITAINEADVGLTVENVSELVASIVQASA